MKRLTKTYSDGTHGVAGGARMTKNEVLRDLDIISFNPHWDELVNEEYLQELIKMAIKALEEVQQYREIGTVEECRAAMEKQRNL